MPYSSTYGRWPGAEPGPRAGDWIALDIRFRGRGKGSGVEIDDTLFWAAELRGGTLYRISEYSTRDEALEAVGVSE